MAPGDKETEVNPVSWQEGRLAYLKSLASARASLKKIASPRYDTLIIRPGDNLTEQVAFCIPRGQSDSIRKPKTSADTNMDVSSMLGTPNQAFFQYLRIHFEKYHSLEDAVSWKETASLEFIFGYNQPVLRTSMGAMEPVLPPSAHGKIGKMIKKGVIKFWPWCEAKLPDIPVDSCDLFQVRVAYSKPFSPRNEMRVKVMLGPWFFGMR